MLTLRTAAAMLAALLISATSSVSQTYPNRPIRIIVPYAAGGGNDILSRMIGRIAGESLGQPIIIENRPGGSTLIGADVVAKSEPDGYTLLYTGSLALNELLYSSKRARTADFQPIILTISVPQVLTVHPSVAHPLPEFIAYAKQNPGKLNYPTFGKGSLPHLSCEMVSAAIGLKMTDVPYRGSAPATQDLLRGEMQVFCDSLAALPNIRDGKVKALAMISSERSPVAPEIPTFAELGYPSLVSSIVQGLYAPAGTSADIIKTINQAVNKALLDPSVRQRIQMIGGNPGGGAPEILAASLQEDHVRYGSIIKALNLQLLDQ